ncbi:MAG TPA: uracil-DNA glycosylase [Opitutaceae bacterium]|nr:uracil-DNA glycosylase [Opitutaceae bacterium]
MALREQLLAVAEELRRRKADGDKTVSIGDETLAALRDLVARKNTGPAPASPVEPPRAPSAPAEASASKSETARHENANAAAAVHAEPKAPPAGTVPRDTGPSTDAAPAKPALKVSTTPADAALPPAPVFDLPTGDKAARWAWLKDFVESHPVCRAHVRPGKKVVLGVGSLDAKIFFCGEAPGAEEEVKGEPFVGPAGQLLTKMIKAMGLERSQVYIGNILNWRPEMPTPPGMEQIGNRPPTAEEMAFCLPFWRAQLEIVQPEIIVALGATAASGLLGAGSFKTLGEIRGHWQTFAGRPVMVTYHPSYLLRNNSNRAKRTVWEDLLKVMERAQLPISDKQRSFFLER